jgi:hypothetical protein
MDDTKIKLSKAEMAVMSERSKKHDDHATPQDCIDDLRHLQEKNPFKFITRNFYRCNGKYSDSTWNQHFGTFAEFRRQAKLELSRNQHSLERKIAKHASVDIYREFYKDEVLPYHEKYPISKKSSGRFKTILVGSDFHDIEVDRFCLSVFLDTAKRIQPDIIVLNGDIFDLYEASKFNIDLRKVKIKERFDFVHKEIFAPLRKHCPSAQIDLIAGNHEWRILTLLAEKTPAMRVILSDVMGLSLADVFGLDKYKINLVCKMDLAAWNVEDIKNEIKENYKVYYDLFVCSHFKDLSFGLSGTSGHTHHPHMETFANIPMGKLSWTTTGCLANTKAEYVQGMDKWTNSFMIAHVDLQKRTVSSEHIMIPGDHAIVHGVRYVRGSK